MLIEFNYCFCHFWSFSTSVSCAWEYSNANNIDYDTAWKTVMDIILKNFAGDPIEGVPSPSVQNTIYITQRDILEHLKEVNNEHKNEILF